MQHHDTHRTYLALLLAVLDGDDERAHELLEPGIAVSVAHYAAHKMVISVDESEHAEMRADLTSQLHAIAAGEA